jgi:hypothetical protein
MGDAWEGGRGWERASKGNFYGWGFRGTVWVGLVVLTWAGYFKGFLKLSDLVAKREIKLIN